MCLIYIISAINAIIWIACSRYPLANTCVFIFLGHHISEQKRNSLVDKEQNLDSLDKKQKRDSLVDKREVVGAMSSKKVNCSEIVGDVANKYIYELDKELDEELECRQNIKKMAQVAVQEEKNMKAKPQ